MSTQYIASEQMIEKAIQQYGLKGMTRGQLSAVIAKNKNIDQFSAQVLTEAARRCRFVRRAMGWH